MFVSQAQLQAINALKPNHYELRLVSNALLSATEQEVLHYAHHALRGDNPDAVMFRSTISRKVFKTSDIPPRAYAPAVYPAGSVLILNNAAGRYKGEVHVIMWVIYFPLTLRFWTTPSTSLLLVFTSKPKGLCDYNCGMNVAALLKHPHEQTALLPRLQQFLDHGIKIIEYTQALTILNEVRERFKEQNFHFGADLATEHERYLAEVYAQGPIAVINYPREIKAFYMLLNDDHKTVACYDILVPGIGELVGGSARETNIAKLTKRMQELNVPAADLMWYLNLRRFGEAASVGFGLGFERLVMYVTGVENIRDVIPYPRTPNNLLF
ncbi:unnamed protein product [Candidula unifasciata]|uniref:Aminoacyl-transfer RNA synthetases class-II family profile domain-containing protein n=1 Tax=Candidula unifasciata TaxID=100452 RepID=A0A8S3ZS47_9EUPU|nr:unnamed protein product [Candidula unifasciata]